MGHEIGAVGDDDRQERCTITVDRSGGYETYQPLLRRCGRNWQASMVRARVDSYLTKIRVELRQAFAEDHTPRQTARSFAAGTFITMLPTLGTGLIVFVILGYLFDSINKLALVASVLVFNPAVKWGVYATSFTLGILLLGPVEGVTMADVSIDAGWEIGVRLLVGNLILAVVAMVIGYLIVYRLAVRYRSTQLGETIDEAVEEVVDEALDA